MKFSSWLQSVPARMTPPPFRLLQIGSAFWQSRALYAAASLDIATALGDAPLPCDELADKVSASTDALNRLMRMLVSMGIFDEVSPAVYRNNTASGYLRQDRPDNLRAMVMMHNSAEMSRPWYEQLEQGVRQGVPPFRLAHGQALFSYMDSHPEFDALFSRAMDSVEVLSGNSFVTDFDWSRFDRIIDVGGSKGSKSVAVLRRYPKLRALVVDRDITVEGAIDAWKARETADLVGRLSFQAGDILEAVPRASGNRDIYFLCAVMHGMDDDSCTRLLRNIVFAIASTQARVAVMELVVPDSKPDYVSTSFDMQMFMGTRGRERTHGEWKSLFTGAGLELNEVVSLRAFGKIMVLGCRPG